MSLSKQQNWWEFPCHWFRWEKHLSCINHKCRIPREATKLHANQDNSNPSAVKIKRKEKLQLFFSNPSLPPCEIINVLWKKEATHFSIQGLTVCSSALTSSFHRTNHFIVSFLHQDQSSALHQSRPSAKPFQPHLEISHFHISFSPLKPMILDTGSTEYTNIFFFFFSNSAPSPALFYLLQSIHLQ